MGTSSAVEPHPDNGVRWLNRASGLMMVLGLILTAVLPISKLFLVPWWALCMGVPMMIVNWKLKDLSHRIETYQLEAQLTGRPVSEVMYRDRDVSLEDDLREIEESFAEEDKTQF